MWSLERGTRCTLLRFANAFCWAPSGSTSKAMTCNAQLVDLSRNSRRRGITSTVCRLHSQVEIN